MKILDELFPHPLPPLKHKDNYTLLIAVLLSARCTDAMVNRVTPALFALADAPKKMVKLSVEQIRKIIQPCGLSPQKAKAIHRLSEILLEKHNGKVPDNFADLEELPGVGHKTASVVLAQGFQVPTFPVDTHIHRLAKRWGISSGKNTKQSEEDLKKFFPRASWIKVHLQIIYFARSYCPALRHDKSKCPICSIL